MKDKIYKNIGQVGFALVLVLVVVVGIEVFANGFKNITKTEALISAFAGAFFAYVFLKIGELFTRLYLSELDNQKSITEIEHTMNTHMNKLHNNLFVADDIINTINKPKQEQNLSNLIAVNFNFFKPIEIEKTSLVKLKNIDFVNDVFDYYADLEKLNDSMVSVQKFYDLLTTSMIEGKLSVDRYRVNVAIVGSKLTELKKFIIAARDKALNIASKAQVLHDQRPPLTRLVVRTNPQFYSNDFAVLVKTKVKQNQKAVKENEKRSRDEIAETLKKDI